MLTHLSIQNYALIRQLEIEFSPGFTVITGETGAGKSILVGALNLVLGKRADSQVLSDKLKKCIVEGIFHIDSYNLREFFDANDLEYDSHVILRREILNNGKSRAFINDTQVNLTLLKDIAEQLIDIHSQHQTVTLNQTDFQLAVIDSYSGNTELVKNYTAQFHSFMRLKKELNDLTEQEKKSKSEQDYYEFLYHELNDAKLIDGEQEQLESELQVLNHAEEIKLRLSLSADKLGGNEINVLSNLNEVRANLHQISAYSEDFTEISSRLEGCFIEISDIFKEIEINAEKITHHPRKADEIKERLDLIYHLQNKHRVKSIAELITLKEELSVKLNRISSLANQIKMMETELEQANVVLNNEAKIISENRKKIFHPIEKEIMLKLTELGMPQARFSIHHQLNDLPGKDGFDAIAFLFNANKGGEMQELSRVASGGERSRLMLAVKSLISQKNLLPTVVFDEIDIGVSGQIADKVGTILNRLAGTMQVIAITHLPQIAGKGNAHYYIYKTTDKNSTKTELKILDPEERVIEIAKMLSGQEVTPASVESAKHLLK